VDGSRFDALTRSLSAPGTRRRVIAGLAAAALAACGVRGAEAACRPGGAACRENANCCSGMCSKNARGRRTCLPEGAACPLPGGDFGILRGGACVGTRGGCRRGSQDGAVVCPDGGACGEIPICDVTVEGALVCDAGVAAFPGGCVPENECEETADCPATAACVVGTVCDTPICVVLCGVGPTGAGVSEDAAGLYRS
jgi:hypothetical protein